MVKRSSGALLTHIKIDKASKVPIYRQLEDHLRGAILSTSLPEGTRIPASRTLAAELDVSRPTIVLVLERLVTEGFLEARHGSGTFVAASIPVQSPHKQRSVDRRGKTPVATLRLSQLGAGFQSMSADIRVTESSPFLPNTPAYDEFPAAAWQKCWRRVSRRRDRESMGYGDPTGYAPLKRNIADYLALHRGDKCNPEQIVITPGGHAAFMLATLLLTNPGDGILFEDPGPSIARNLFASLDRRLIFTPVGDGKNFEQIEVREPAIRMAFTMPSRHHPLGHTLSLTRRLRLLEWADKNDAWIIEDDYDSEFRYSGRPLTSMRSIDASERVIYVGTFSKALYPSLRVGYLVLPPALVDVFRNAMALIVRSPPLEVQMVLAEFIGEGYFAAHLRHMRELYSVRRTHFIEAAKKTTTGLMKIDEPDSGMNMIAWLPAGVSDIGVYENAMIKGIYCYPLSHYCAVPNARSALILGFTNVKQQELAPGLEQLSRIIELAQKG